MNGQGIQFLFKINVEKTKQNKELRLIGMNYE